MLEAYDWSQIGCRTCVRNVGLSVHFFWKATHGKNDGEGNRETHEGLCLQGSPAVRRRALRFGKGTPYVLFGRHSYLTGSGVQEDSGLISSNSWEF